MKNPFLEIHNRFTNGQLLQGDRELQLQEFSQLCEKLFHAHLIKSKFLININHQVQNEVDDFITIINNFNFNKRELTGDKYYDARDKIIYLAREAYNTLAKNPLISIDKNFYLAMLMVYFKEYQIALTQLVQRKSFSKLELNYLNVLNIVDKNNSFNSVKNGKLGRIAIKQNEVIGLEDKKPVSVLPLIFQKYIQIAQVQSPYRCYTIPVGENNKCIFSILQDYLQMIGEYEFAKKFGRELFITLILKLVQQGDIEKIPTALINNILKVNGCKNLQEWIEKFRKGTIEIQAIHLFVLSQYYKLQFSVYHLLIDDKVNILLEENREKAYYGIKINPVNIYLAQNPIYLSLKQSTLENPYVETTIIQEHEIGIKNKENNNNSNTSMAGLVKQHSSLFVDVKSNTGNKYVSDLQTNLGEENTGPRKSLKNPREINSLLKTIMPAFCSLGTAYDEGDCFFDSLAQFFYHMSEADVQIIKYLRRLCHEFYSENKELVDGWNEKDYGGIDNKKDEYYMVQYTAEDCKKDFYGRSPIWGRPGIEGVILCRKLNLEGILVIEVLEDPETQLPVPSFNLANESTYKNISEENAQQYLNNPNIPVLVVEQNSLHFVPLLRNELNHTNGYQIGNEENKSVNIVFTPGKR